MLIKQKTLLRSQDLLLKAYIPNYVILIVCYLITNIGEYTYKLVSLFLYLYFFSENVS